MRTIFIILIFRPFFGKAQKTKTIKLSEPTEHRELIPGVVSEPDENKIVCGGNGEIMPQPAYDLNKYLVENIVYPQAAKDSNMDGRVITGFIVTETGAIDSVYIARSVHPLIDSQALRVVRNMPPGHQENSGESRCGSTIKCP